MTTDRAKAPLFEFFSVEQLTTLTPYSEAYLRDLEGRPGRIRPQFKRVVARCLGRPEDELFGAEGGGSTEYTNRQVVDEASQAIDVGAA